MRALSSLLAASLMAVLLGQGVVSAQNPTVKVSIVNAARVYCPRNVQTGSVVEKTKPVLVDAKVIFDATPEYQRIRSENIKKDSAEYKLLTSAASDRFKSAVSRVMSLSGYDLVAETGAIMVAGQQLPDVTQEVVDNL